MPEINKTSLQKTANVNNNEFFLMVPAAA